MLQIEHLAGDTRHDYIRILCDQCGKDILWNDVIYLDLCNGNPLELCSLECVEEYASKMIGLRKK